MTDFKPKPNESIIYIVRSKLDETEIYIGKTDRLLSDRKKEHFDKARKGDGNKFHNALVNTGFLNWDWDILETCDREKVLDIERKHIKNFAAQDIEVLNTTSPVAWPSAPIETP